MSLYKCPLIATLWSASSIVDSVLGSAAKTALRILTRVQDAKDKDGSLVDLAYNTCGLVYTFVVEYQQIVDNGRTIPGYIQQHIQTLAANVLSIENFAIQMLWRNSLGQMTCPKDIAEIAQYREMLRQWFNVYGLQHLQQLMEEPKWEGLRHSIGGTPNPYSYNFPAFSAPIPETCPYMHVPYFYPPHPLPSIQPQGGIVFNINYNANSGNSSNIVISNVGNNTRSRREHRQA